MATIYSDQAAVDYRGSNLADGRNVLGELSILTCRVTLDGTQADEDDIILFNDVPKGTLLLGPISRVETLDSSAATMTVDYGTATLGTALGTAIDQAATGQDALTGIYELTATENVVAKIKTLGTPAAGHFDVYLIAKLP
jgi:hypothetical protein